MKKYMTVVFEYTEGAQLPKKITESFSSNSDFEDAKITAVSMEDEITKLEKLEETTHSTT